jgi:hypothetical protein
MQPQDPMVVILFLMLQVLVQLQEVLLQLVVAVAVVMLLVNMLAWLGGQEVDLENPVEQALNPVVTVFLDREMREVVPLGMVAAAAVLEL